MLFRGGGCSGVVAISSGLEGKSICCAYVPFANAGLSVAAIKQQLAKALPRYMIPVRWMALEAMPRNRNGKTDRPLLTQWFEREGEAAPVPGASLQTLTSAKEAGSVRGL